MNAHNWGMQSAPFWRWGLVQNKKLLEIAIRSHLSSVSALALSVLVLAREWHELTKLGNQLGVSQWTLLLVAVLTAIALPRYCLLMYLRTRVELREHVIVVALPVVCLLLAGSAQALLREISVVSPGDWLILIVTVATLGAAIWELRGEKISVSPRDEVFRLNSLLLVRALGVLNSRDLASGPDASENQNSDFDRFIEIALSTASKCLCGQREVSVVLLAELNGSLVVQHVAQNATTYIASDASISATSQCPSSIAFALEKIIEVKDIEIGEAWPHDYSSVTVDYSASSAQERETNDTSLPCYSISAPVKCLVKEQAMDNSRAFLCVPIRYRMRGGIHRKIGILRFDTKHVDPFLPQDMFMAEYFAEILAIALKQTAEGSPPPKFSQDKKGGISPDANPRNWRGPRPKR